MPNTALKVQIKGIREGLLVTLSEGPWPEMRAAFFEQVQQQSDFLKGGRLILDVGDKVMRAAELGQLRDDLSELGLTLWAILSSSKMTEHTAQSLGLATRITRPIHEQSNQLAETSLSGEQAILVQRTLRSGFRLHHSGHVVVIGDVNPGAEIVAGGDVVVWGRLRGMVHAGSEGDENAIVCALELSPTQLRIGNHSSLVSRRRGRPKPEIARLVNGAIITESWQAK